MRAGPGNRISFLTRARPPLINETAQREWERGRVGARTHCLGSEQRQTQGQDAIAVAVVHCP